MDVSGRCRSAACRKLLIATSPIANPAVPLRCHKAKTLGATVSPAAENSHYQPPRSCPPHPGPPGTFRSIKGNLYEPVCLFCKQKFFTCLKAPSYCFNTFHPSSPICILHLGERSRSI